MLFLAFINITLFKLSYQYPSASLLLSLNYHSSSAYIRLLSHYSCIIFSSLLWFCDQVSGLRCPSGGVTECSNRDDQNFSISSMLSQFMTIMALIRLPLRSTCLCVALLSAGQSATKEREGTALTPHQTCYSAPSHSTSLNAPPLSS